MILSQFKRVMLLPYNLVTSPRTLLNALSGQTKRSRGFWMGVPAILVATIGVGSLMFANFGAANALLGRYNLDVTKTRKEKGEIVQKLLVEMRSIEVNRRNAAGSDAKVEGIPEDDPRRVRLREVQQNEEILLKKLITLSPNELDYRFQLALLSLDQNDLQKGLAMMQNLAPESEPGYDKAHMWMCTFLLSRPVESRAQLNLIRSKALIHAEMCLIRDQNNQKAKLIKANLLVAGNQLEKAYVIFKELYDQDPAFYENLTRINNRLDRSHLNRTIYETAERHFLNQTKQPDISVSDWMQAWSQVVRCQAEKKDFAGIEKRLLAEHTNLGSAEGDEAIKRIFIGEMLANVYIAWGDSTPDDRPNRDKIRLDYVIKAFEYDPNDANVLRILTRFAVGKDETLAAVARTIYDPAQQADAPAEVYNELGAQALSDSDYENSRKYFEMALKKAPQNPQVLNNLAYTYLVCEDRDPARSLKLVDQALQLLPESEQIRIYLSHFYDTKGNALMQLNRMTEAYAAFEIALQDRPDNREILEALVKCSQANNLSPKVFEDRLKQLDEQQE